MKFSQAEFPGKVHPKLKLNYSLTTFKLGNAFCPLQLFPHITNPYLNLLYFQLLHMQLATQMFNLKATKNVLTVASPCQGHH